ADFEQKFECIPHPAGIPGAVTIADDRLRSLSQSLERQHCKLHDTCQNCHGTHRNVSSITLERTVKTYGNHALTGLHDKSSDPQRQTGKYDIRRKSQILSLYPQKCFLSAQKGNYPYTGE